MYTKYGHIPNVKKLPKKNINPLRKNTPRFSWICKECKEIDFVSKVERVENIHGNGQGRK